MALAPDGRDVGERQLKAEMIVRMLRLVTWARPGARAAALPLTLTVVGDAALADALRDASAGQRVDGRPLVVAQVPTLAHLPSPPPGRRRAHGLATRTRPRP